MSSFWLEAAGDVPRRAPLSGTVEADVCIVGGGFTGLWTAYELRRADPRLSVVVLEAQHVGFGASGRNGGWVVGEVAGSSRAWRRRAGGDPGAADAMARAVRGAVEEIGAVVAHEGISCDWCHGGSLTVAQNQTQLARLRAAATSEGAGAELLDAGALRARVAVAGGVGALYTPWCARMQPARLVRGLASACERAGVVVYEGSRVVSWSGGVVRVSAGAGGFGGAGGVVRVGSSGGVVRARQVVLAVEGYTPDLPGRHRALLPLGSSMIVTAPLPSEFWSSVGWSGCETLLDGAYAYTYSQRTADDRIAIGGRGVPYRFGSKTDREGPVPESTVAALRARLAGLFPGTASAPVARAWHGVLGVARDWCPSVCFDRDAGVAWAGGYAGEGVAASNLAARCLRDLLLGRDSELTRLPWVDTAARAWEVEPLRWLGARGVYGLYRAGDRAEARHDRPSRLARVADLISGR